MGTGKKTGGYRDIPRWVQGIRRRGTGAFLGAYSEEDGGV